ncbi:crossover junction endodeoxyribonuclease RuvC [Arachidicoccus ginsenosidimutans]|uniref:crossover junction endodeoxyribonuclease RuvC n=1 Tax=Arachidicoccus sp. BS20 TaxID=1850526 RepID=UPI0007F1118F|nr:crossover junction endodeoxyribonuclease RuvC [Arachidicoccus sp. BS20]ANI89213.1 crossover junction endodeoxyribonuclease RuvC [Arachidicoccus sp. BS20]
MKKSNPVILAIDPGTIKMGYAIVQFSDKKLQLLSMGTLLLSSHKDVYVRLQKIHATVVELIEMHAPSTFAIEAPFFGKNVQSMLKLGRAQGVAIAAAMQHNISVTEYSPKKVKQSVTGNGNASKEQVWKMLQQLFSIKEEPKYFDASDALAVALCHHYQTNSPLGKLSKGLKGWEDFLAKNPERLI